MRAVADTNTVVSALLWGGARADVLAAAREQHLNLSRARHLLPNSTVRKTVDMIIATFCLLGGHVLLHSDRDSDVMEKHLGMRVLREPRTD